MECRGRKRGREDVGKEGQTGRDCEKVLGFHNQTSDFVKLMGRPINSWQALIASRDKPHDV